MRGPLLTLAAIVCAMGVVWPGVHPAARFGFIVAGIRCFVGASRWVRSGR